jgi:HSP20 family molecular chaperone IbpA
MSGDPNPAFLLEHRSPPKAKWYALRRSRRTRRIKVMYIERTTVGSITIDGKTYEHDVVIRLSGDGAKITAELPGMEENDIEVNVSDDVLTIKGEKKEAKKDYYVSERHYGSFHRSFHIPDSIDTNKIEASFRNGLLTVTLPKTAQGEKKAKNIEVKKG